MFLDTFDGSVLKCSQNAWMPDKQAYFSAKIIISERRDKRVQADKNPEIKKLMCTC